MIRLLPRLLGSFKGTLALNVPGFPVSQTCRGVQSEHEKHRYVNPLRLELWLVRADQRAMVTCKSFTRAAWVNLEIDPAQIVNLRSLNFD